MKSDTETERARLEDSMGHRFLRIITSIWPETRKRDSNLKQGVVRKKLYLNLPLITKEVLKVLNKTALVNKISN